jgi:hypothetical protein
MSIIIELKWKKHFKMNHFVNAANMFKYRINEFFISYLAGTRRTLCPAINFRRHILY